MTDEERTEIYTMLEKAISIANKMEQLLGGVSGGVATLAVEIVRKNSEEQFPRQTKSAAYCISLMEEDGILTSNRVKRGENQ